MVKNRGVGSISIADDSYLVGPAPVIAEGWEQMETVLASYGHRLRRTKCWFWGPALDVLESAVEGTEVRGAAASLEAIIPRQRGSLVALGRPLRGSSPPNSSHRTRLPRRRASGQCRQRRCARRSRRLSMSPATHSHGKWRGPSCSRVCLELSITIFACAHLGR